VISVSSHKPNGTTIPCAASYSSLADAKREAESAAKHNRGFIYIVWQDGYPLESWSFPKQEVAV